MYSTCLFCNASLEKNEVVEAFPVGRRLAFDATKGRLWVVCRKCERWNLTPLEERWEAIEDCERRFRDARLRVSTDNVGMAKLREGLELVRIGEPQRPELAAWRYGDQFGRRRRQMLLRGTLAVGAIGAVTLGAATAGVGIGGFWWMFNGVYDRLVHGGKDDTVARVAHEGATLVVKRKHLAKSSFVRAYPEVSGMELHLRHKGGSTVLVGETALLAARQVLPQANRRGGTKRDVQDAVSLLERAGDATRALHELAAGTADRNGQPLGVPFVHRLALEMALHEEQERRALAGELAALEAEWRRAEEIAAIADTLFDAPGIDEKLQALRDRG